MRDELAHRGPDGAGLWTSPDGEVWLAHRRLAIVDLSPAGHQPMGDPTGAVWLTFNGEIYNHVPLRHDLRARGHQFRSTCDTEVLLAAYLEWGEDCLARLDGMFAFGLYDGRSRRLFLARDRAGEKPLFYHLETGRLRFASELKALFADPDFPRVLDLESLDHYLAQGYVPGDRSLVAGVRKLEQGSALTFDLPTRRVRTWRYWQLPPTPDEGAGRSGEQELVDDLESLLATSVARQMAADVPVGILLSGGIDSGLVAAMAARAGGAAVRTFTVAFPGHGQLDEGPRARAVARHLGTDHTELVAESTTVDLLPLLARQYDEPIADSSMVPTFIVSRLIREHATVALGGDGGDELFGGYNHYRRLQRTALLKALVPGPVRSLAGRAVASGLPVGFRGRNWLLGLPGDLADAIGVLHTIFDPVARASVLSADAARRAAGRATPESHWRSLCDGGTAIQEATSVDFRTHLVDGILVKVDRASMLTSLEVRCPWLDHHVVDFAFSRLPDHLRATPSEGKVLPRRLAARHLPAELVSGPKQGFSLPLTAWFNDEWGSFVAGVLGDVEPALFDPAAVQSLLAGQRRGYSNTERLFALTMFELWRREYRVSLP